MDCNLIQPDLVPYHFGVIEDDARRRVEQHLGECPRCLADFFALKREMETTEARPSPAARDRLRASVLEEIDRHKVRVLWSWWERPLAVAFASAAVFAAIFSVHVLASSPGSAPHALLTQGYSQSAQ